MIGLKLIGSTFLSFIASPIIALSKGLVDLAIELQQSAQKDIEAEMEDTRE